MMKNLILLIILTALGFSLNTAVYCYEGDEPEERKEQENMQLIHRYMQMGDAYRRLSKIAAKKKQYTKAIGYLEKLLPLFDKLSPHVKKKKKATNLALEKVEVQLRIADLYYKSGNEKKAKSIIDKLLSSGKVPERVLPGIYLKLSKHYEQQNDIEKAEQMLLKSLEINQKLLK